MTSRSDRSGPRRHIPWTKAEVEHLQLLAGELPFPVLIKRYNLWAIRQTPELPRRSSSAIRYCAETHGISLRCGGGEYLTLHDIEILLGICPKRIHRWVRTGKIKIIRPYRRRPYLTRAELERAATEHPELFKGITRDRLYQLFESEELVDQVIASQPIKIGPNGQLRVKCMETGKIWPSIAAAAKAVFRDPRSIGRAAQQGGRSAGRRWQVVA